MNNNQKQKAAKRIMASEMNPLYYPNVRLVGGWEKQPADCLHSHTAPFELTDVEGGGSYCKDCGIVMKLRY